MSRIYGKDTLESLDLPLNQIYALRRSQSNLILMHKIDEYLAHRPDWIAYRLVRERQPHAQLEVPAQFSGGTALLHYNLVRAANSNDQTKWTVYGLIALWILRLTQQNEPRWCVRVPPSDSWREAIPDTDRVTRRDLRGVLQWMESRQKKFRLRTSTEKDYTLRNVWQRSSLEQLEDIEKLLLLALGKLSIFLGACRLDEGSRGLAVETLGEFTRLVSAANGGWWPGQAIFTQNLRHHRPDFRDNLFSSSYLPFDQFDYVDWFAASLGEFVKRTEGLLNPRERLILGLSCLLFREWLLSRAIGSEKEHEEADRLIIATDRLSVVSLEAGSVVIASGLAARFLDAGNMRGWKGLPYERERAKRARNMKALAKIGGCLVRGDAQKRSFSELYRSADPYGLPPNTPATLPAQTDQVGNIVEESGSEESHDPDLAAVARAVKVDARSDAFYILKTAVICLTPGKGRPENLDALLDVQQQAFRVFICYSLAGGVAALAQQLRARGRFSGSVFGVAANVVGFAELLLYWLERPYMADFEIRAGWQRELWHAYVSLDKHEAHKLELDDKLVIYAAVAHGASAALKGLHGSYADQLEQTIYEEDSDTSASIRNLRARARLRVRSYELWNIVKQHEERALQDTALVQLVVTPGTGEVKVFVVRRCGEESEYREDTVPFQEACHDEYYYGSWTDLSERVRDYRYFDAVGGLTDFEVSPLGQASVVALWHTIESLILEAGPGIPQHIWLTPDAVLADIPWQLIAMKATTWPAPHVLVTLVPGLRWIYMTAHHPELAQNEPGNRQLHFRGIRAWIASTPTPSAQSDARPAIQSKFFNVDVDKPVLSDERGVSLSVVFGHGAIKPGEAEAKTEAVPDSADWYDIREARICLVLSCYTGAGKAGALGDYLSIAHKLWRKSKAILLPPVEVPHTAALTLADVFHTALSSSLDGTSKWRIQEVYQEAIRQDPTVALFSLWGLGYEPVVWRSQYATAYPWHRAPSRSESD